MDFPTLFPDLEMPEPVDWCGLPEELLQLILKRLPLPDYLRFGAVCTTWRSIASKKCYPPARQLPWLMLLDERCRQHKALNFYCLSQKKAYKLDISERSCLRKQWIGCCSGWLMSMCSNSQIYMLNPFSKLKIRLPPATRLTEFARPISFSEPADTVSYIKKVVLLPPEPEGNRDYYTILVIYGTSHKLAYYKSGDRKWTGLQDLGKFYDIIHYKDKFYGLTRDGVVFCYDLSRRFPKVEKLTGLPLQGSCTTYFIESQGDLLLVVRCLVSATLRRRNINFDVFKFDERKNKWERLINLGKRSLFVSRGGSTSLSAAEFPECKENCIYYAADDCGLSFKFGIYHFEDGSVEIYDQNNSPLLNLPAIWFVPNPW